MQRGRQRQNRHHFARYRNIEARFANHAALRFSAQPHDDLSQRPVVHVQHPLPGDRIRVDIQHVSAHQLVVDHRRQLVIRGGHGVNVARQVQIERLHRHNLRVSAARRAALDAERRPLRWLAQRHDSLFAQVLHRLTQPHRRRRFALAERRRRDRRHDDVLGSRAVFQLVERAQPQLGDIRAAIGIEIVGCQTHLRGDFLNRF